MGRINEDKNQYSVEKQEKNTRNTMLSVHKIRMGPGVHQDPKRIRQ